eukprot:1916741-Pyramimonas_sp.AAC.1
MFFKYTAMNQQAATQWSNVVKTFKDTTVWKNTASSIFDSLRMPVTADHVSEFIGKAVVAIKTSAPVLVNGPADITHDLRRSIGCVVRDIVNQVLAKNSAAPDIQLTDSCGSMVEALIGTNPVGVQEWHWAKDSLNNAIATAKE